MPEPLKNIYSKNFIKRISNILAELDSRINSHALQISIQAHDWPELELKARMSRIAKCLHQAMHDAGISDFESQTALLIKFAKPLRQLEQKGFEYMFLPDFVEQFGQADFEISTNTLAALTDLASSEFAIRPFIIQDPNRTLALMAKWSNSKSEHLRRLASEGCRPRLPWAMALPSFKHDPAPILDILETLKDDVSLYVRRSVANNLNDISKDNPEIVVSIAKAWFGQNEQRDWVVKHACRGLLKAAQPDIMQVFGFSAAGHIELRDLKASTEVEFGNSLDFSFALQSKQRLGKLRIEFAIDHMKANGKHTRKIFKLAEADYDIKAKQISRSHAIKAISTRKYYNGEHHLAILVNGIELESRTFSLSGVTL